MSISAGHAHLSAATPRSIRVEVAIVLGLSFGASAVYSLVAIANRLTKDEALGQQTATLNPSLSDRPVFDFLYQLLAVFFDLVPVALVCFLLWNTAKPHLSGLGIDRTRPVRDLRDGLGLALLIGLPGLALYFAGRALGITVNVIPATLDAAWWTIPLLLLAAVRAGVTEEVIVVGYLFNRLRMLGWGSWQIIISTALLRGTYHLYQGFGSFVGNVAMGIVFGWLYHKHGRLLPLVLAHVAIDAAVFIGYPWAYASLPGVFS